MKTLTQRFATMAAGTLIYLPFRLQDSLRFIPRINNSVLAAFLLVVFLGCFFLYCNKIRKPLKKNMAVNPKVKLFWEFIIRKILAIVMGFLMAWLFFEIHDFRLKMAWFGIPISNVQEMKATLLSDPTIINAEKWIGEVAIREVSSENVSANAHARALIFGRGKPTELSTGRNITIVGSAKWSEANNTHSVIVNVLQYSEDGWRSNYHRLRHNLLATFQKRLSTLGTNSVNLLSALLLGRKIDNQSLLVYNLRQTGCMHLLAISGFHLGLIALGIKSLVKPFVGFHAAACISALCSILYLQLIGFKPSLLRAVLMYLLYTFDSIRGIKGRAMNYLCCAFVIHLAIFPTDFNSLSFQLSYTALFGILSSGQTITCLLSRYLPSKISIIFGAGLGAQIFTLPIVIQHFGVWRPVGLIASPILTVLVSLLMVTGSIFMFSGLIPGDWLDFLVRITDFCLEIFSWVPGIKPGIHVAWLISVLGVILPQIILWRIRHHSRHSAQPQFPILNPLPAQKTKPVSPKTVVTKFSDKPTGKAAYNKFTARD